MFHVRAAIVASRIRRGTTVERMAGARERRGAAAQVANDARGHSDDLLPAAQREPELLARRVLESDHSTRGR